MELSKQVCSLEQSKRLKELGVSCKTLFYWSDCSKPREPEIFELTYQSYTSKCGWKEEVNYYPAFTVAELGVMLPQNFEDGSFITMRVNEEWIDLNNEREYMRGRWIIHPINDDSVSDNIPDYTTEAEARAAMLIYLLENNLTTAQEVNERLTQQTV